MLQEHKPAVVILCNTVSPGYIWTWVQYKKVPQYISDLTRKTYLQNSKMYAPLIFFKCCFSCFVCLVFNASKNIWCFLNTSWRQKSSPVRKQAGEGQPAGTPVDACQGGPLAWETASSSKCTAHTTACSPWSHCWNSLQQEGKQIFVSFVFAIKHLWSEILSNGVRSILH